MHSCASIFEKPVEGHYCQTLTINNYYILLELTGPSDIVTLQLGHDTLLKTEEIISQTPDISSKELIEMQQESLPKEVYVNMCVAKIDGDLLNLSATGECGAKIVRGNKIINLLAASNLDISGKMQKNDLLILGTAHFLASNPLTNLFGVNSVGDAREALIPTQGSALLVEYVLEKAPVTLPVSVPQLPLQRRRLLYFVFLFFIILLSIIIFQLRGRSLEQKANLIQKINVQAQENLASANKLLGLNDILARQILTQARKDFIAAAGDNINDKKLQETLKIIDQQLTIAAKIYQVTNLDLFYDFSLLKAGADISNASIITNEIAAVDKVNGSVYTLGTKNKTADIMGSNEGLKLPASIDTTGTSFYMQNSNGIFSLRKSDKGNVLLAIKPSDKWGRILGLKTFAGNLYLLDVTNSQVWKYQGTDFGFSDINPYLRAEAVDFSNVSDFAIDGYIYVLSQSGNVVKFSSGMPEDFKLLGLDTPLQKPTKIYASDETQNIYILDGSRVVVFDKKGTYVSQYMLPTTNSGLITTLLADEAVKKVFLLTGAKVFSFDLR